MDRNQIYFIIVGLFLIPVGVYLYYLQMEYIISSSVTLLGISFVISGFRYKERMKYRGLTGEARHKYLDSTYFVVSIIGTIILFAGMGGVAIANFVHSKAMMVLFFVLFLIGMLVLFLGRTFRGKALRDVDKAEKHL